MSPIARLCKAAAPGWPSVSDAVRARACAHAAGFVAREIALAPAHIRGGIGMLGLVFRLVLPLCGGNPDRAARLAPPLARYWQLIRQLAVLAYLEHPELLDAVGMTNGAARQTAFRARRAAESAP